MINLSVNVNKIATLRNSRGGNRPSVPWAVKVCIAAGAHGITVHPRADRRHITTEDVLEIAQIVRSHSNIEYNIEGDPRPDWMDLVLSVRPDQATLVPVTPGEVTSNHGYRFPEDANDLKKSVAALKNSGIRVSVFVDRGVKNLKLARNLGIDRVELYTEPYARAFERGQSDASEEFRRLEETAREAIAAGLEINAGHDLDLHNLPLLCKLPGLKEVSIGHALISDALETGLDVAVRTYLTVIAENSAQTKN